MTTQFLLCLLAGAAAGGFINGLAGFGTALFALGFFLNVMTPLEAVTIVVSLSVLSGLQGVWLVRKAVGENIGRLLGFLLPAIIGIPLGVSLLSILEPGTLKLFIAFFLILYGGYFSLRRALPTIEGPRPAIDAAIGFAGGLLGGAASLSGALPTMWCSMRPWPRAETRAVLQPFNVTVLGLTALMLAWKGAYDRDTLTHILIALPVTLTFAQIGIFTFNRMSDVFFRRLLIWLTLLSGVILALRELT